MKKEEKLFDAITELPDPMVEEARAAHRKRHPFRRRWAALAAALAVVVGIGFILSRDQDAETILTPLDGAGGALLEVALPQAYAFEDYDARREIWDANPVDEGFLSALDTFSYETAAQVLSGDGENENYSPLSLYYALALASTGARGQTARELSALLGVSDRNALSQQCGNLYRTLYTDNEMGKLYLANSLWMAGGVTWKEAFVENAAEQFYASVFPADFSAPETGTRMSQWVSEQTNGLLAPTFDIDPEQILSILNTVYFKDEWTSRFDPEATAEDSFTRADGSTVTCDFMNRIDYAGFSRGEDFTRAGMPLKNMGQMIFILPDEGVELSELLASPEALQEAFEGGEDGYGQVTWKIPKFSFHTELDLKEPLKALGVQSAFRTDADFSGLTDQDAWFSAVRQETRISVDENGVEAAAYTELAYSGAGMPQDQADMILDRPFLYGVTAANGALLFIGVCADPTLS